jgi:hypothetical protein
MGILAPVWDIAQPFSFKKPIFTNFWLRKMASFFFILKTEPASALRYPFDYLID